MLATGFEDFYRGTGAVMIGCSSFYLI